MSDNSTKRRTVPAVPQIDASCSRRPRRMSSGRFWSIILLIAAGVFIAPAAANGAGEDPLGLLIGYDVSTYYSLG